MLTISGIDLGQFSPNIWNPLNTGFNSLEVMDSKLFSEVANDILLQYHLHTMFLFYPKVGEPGRGTETGRGGHV